MYQPATYLTTLTHIMDFHTFPIPSLLLFIAAATVTAYLYTIYPTGEPKVSDRKVPITNLRDTCHLLKDSTLCDRAFPNQRLVKAFGIQNAFTTTNGDIYHAFVLDVNKKLRMEISDWEVVVRNALGHLDKLKTKVDDTVAPLSPEVQTQIFVFKVIVQHFFPEISEISNFDVELITASINQLWTASKSCSSPLTARKKELLQAISTIFNISPDLDPNGDGRNPLNIILPAYETLWRVVLRCFLEVQFRSTTQDAGMHDSFAKFLRDPTQSNFETGSQGKIPVKTIVQEALRLYPPTRRIHRFTRPIEAIPEGVMFHILRSVANFFSHQLGAAANLKINYAIDVEHLHRDPDIWGEDALDFNPFRADNPKRIGFMPFGARPFICPAGNSFALMMIGICVGAMLYAFPDENGDGGESWKLVDGEGVKVDLRERYGPLDNGREGLGGLFLVRE
jgi:hypothetical protein